MHNRCPSLVAKALSLHLYKAMSSLFLCIDSICLLSCIPLLEHSPMYAVFVTFVCSELFPVLCVIHVCYSFISLLHTAEFRCSDLLTSIINCDYNFITMYCKLQYCVGECFAACSSMCMGLFVPDLINV